MRVFSCFEAILCQLCYSCSQEVHAAAGVFFKFVRASSVGKREHANKKTGPLSASVLWSHCSKPDARFRPINLFVLAL